MEIQISSAELPLEGDYKYFDYPELKQELLVLRRNGKIEIFSSFCPHFGGPLTYKEGKLNCYFHNYAFDIETGACLNKDFGARCKKIEFFEDQDGLVMEVE